MTYLSLLLHSCRALVYCWSIVLFLFAFPNSVRAVAITDPVGDFLPTYTGTQAGDLDVIAADVILDGNQLVFSGTVNGTVGTTAGTYYVFGLDRGLGAPIFALSGSPLLPNEDKVLFDAAVVISGDGLTGLVADLSTGAPVITPFPTSDITISGNTVTATLPLSLFTTSPAFLPPQQYAFNLWPRLGLDASNNAQVSDFAPDNATASVSPVPEPAGLGLAAFGILFWLFRGRGRTSEPSRAVTASDY